MVLFAVTALVSCLASGRRLGLHHLQRYTLGDSTHGPTHSSQDFDQNVSEIAEIRKSQNFALKVINVWEAKCRDPAMIVRMMPHSAALYSMVCGPALAMAKMVSQWFSSPELEESLGAETLGNFAALLQLLDGLANTATTMNILDEKKEILFRSDGEESRREKDRMDLELDDKIKNIYEGLRQTQTQMLGNLKTIAQMEFTKTRFVLSDIEQNTWEEGNKRYLEERMKDKFISRQIDSWCKELPPVKQYDDIEMKRETWFACQYQANISALPEWLVERCGCIQDKDETWYVTRNAVPCIPRENECRQPRKSFLDPFMLALAQSHVHKPRFVMQCQCDYIEFECPWNCPDLKVDYQAEKKYQIRVIRNWVFSSHWMELRNGQNSFLDWLACEKQKPSPFVVRPKRNTAEHAPCFTAQENALSPEGHIRYIARAYMMLAASHGHVDPVQELRYETADSVKFLKQARHDFNEYLAFYTSNTAMTAAIQNEQLLQQNQELLRKVDHIEQVLDHMSSSSVK